LSFIKDKANTKAAIFAVILVISIGGVLLYNAFVNQPMLSDASNSATTTSIVSSCTYDWWNFRTNVYLNNDLHLYFGGNLNLLVGANYTITYRDDSFRMLSWELVK